jgi:hypothetical protein
LTAALALGDVQATSIGRPLQIGKQMRLIRGDEQMTLSRRSIPKHHAVRTDV